MAQRLACQELAEVRQRFVGHDGGEQQRPGSRYALDEIGSAGADVRDQFGAHHRPDDQFADRLRVQAVAKVVLGDRLPGLGVISANR